VNGVHDMGGMHGLGPIAREPDEPVFHARWEARALALTLAAGAWGRWNIDRSRHQRELIPGPDYLRMSYYEKWIAGLVELVVETGLATREEVSSGRPDPDAPRQRPPLTPDRVAPSLAHGGPSERDVAAAPRFSPGAQVRARNINPAGHTRLPRYARGHVGVITRGHGAHVFPDANAHGLGERPQHLYQVRFAARELWGEDAAAADSVHLDLWEDYLEPA
jgi:nitrile hydratase beta subunit